jgi:hypothetical protein
MHGFAARGSRLAARGSRLAGRVRRPGLPNSMRVIADRHRSWRAGGRSAWRGACLDLTTPRRAVRRWRPTSDGEWAWCGRGQMSRSATAMRRDDGAMRGGTRCGVTMSGRGDNS